MSFHVTIESEQSTDIVIAPSEGVFLLTPREFARNCCDFATTRFATSSKYQHEEGVVDYFDLLFSMAISHETTMSVYIGSANIIEFADNVLFKLPKNKRLVLITGQEDYGPCSVFGHSLPKFKGKKNSDTTTLKRVLNDKRLKHWFAQNYDFKFGENENCTIDLSSSELDKVEPFPIGLDFHTFSEKTLFRPARVSPKQQQARILELASKSEWIDKKQEIIIGFTAGPREKPSRKQALESITRVTTCSRRIASTIDRDTLWKWHVDSAYVLAPQGRGIDTHRVYEALALKSVPIVISSPLDKFYSQFPIIILKNWDELSDCSVLQKWKSEIIRRFGQVPFSNVQVLDMNYWRAQVEKAKQA